MFSIDTNLMNPLEPGFERRTGRQDLGTQCVAQIVKTGETRRRYVLYESAITASMLISYVGAHVTMHMQWGQPCLFLDVIE